MFLEPRNPGGLIFSEALTFPPWLHSNCFSFPFVSCGSAALKAALVIQNWYRGHSAQLKTRQRYALTIFQSIEYADEQGQLEVCFASLSLILVKCFPLPLLLKEWKFECILSWRTLVKDFYRRYSDIVLELATERVWFGKRMVFFSFEVHIFKRAARCLVN